MTLTYTEQLQADYTRIRMATRDGSITKDERMQQIDDATKRYALSHAEAYDASKLEKTVLPINFKNDRTLDAFSDLVLYEDLTWSHADKMSLMKYPIMSDRQTKRRASKAYMPGEIEHEGRQNNGRRSLVYTDNTDTMRSSKPRMPSQHETDMNELVTTLDLKQAISNANLTDRQAEASYYVYGIGLTQARAAEKMGVTRQAVTKLCRDSVRKLRVVMT